MDFIEKIRFSARKSLPLLRQTQAAECGLACIGMIAGYYGYKMDMLTLRKKYAMSLKGSTLTDIINLAGHLGLVTRALRLEVEELSQLRLPAILHWDMKHYIVLSEIHGDKVTIHDPARGRRILKIKDLAASFTGIALELVPQSDFEKREEKESLSMLKLLGNISGIKSVFAQLMILTLSLEIFGIITPFYMQWVLDQVLVSSDYNLMTLLGCAFIIVVLLQNGITALRTWVTTWFSSLLSVQWSSNICSHLLNLPQSWFEERHMGDIVSRFGSINNIQSTLTTRFISSVFDGVMSIITLGIIVVYSPSLSLIVVGLFLAYTTVRMVAFQPFRQASEDQMVANSQVQSQLIESIRGSQAIMLSNKQNMRVSTYTNELVEATNNGIKIQRLSIFFTTVQGILSGVGRIVLIWLAALQVLDGHFSSGMLMSFITFSDQFISRASGLIDAFIEFRMLRLHGERLSDIVLSERETDMLNLSAHPDPIHAVSVEFKNLSFRYSPTEPWILKQVNMLIHAGESVAIVGPSGQGKTTLARLLLGLLRAEEGAIIIDGVENVRLGMTWVRNNTGSVMQDDQLFAGSILDNICFFDADFDMSMVEEAAKIAQVHTDIIAMPMGYNSLVGDMGSALSGGQIQRLLLARALYKKPSILLLDEATSHLDIYREKAINEAIRKMSITRIIIAHRPETIMSADRIFVVANHKINEVDKASLFGIQNGEMKPALT
ncbi:peptidase domain-containing ABC transporter [Enterobacter sp. SGAir0187]|uniref:peptidase domain-containing ABC transporter n=1 Tax=Enterobacter sp. SGAir0187 TaxID=2836161 RepID=UPI000CEB7BF2|nr:peptidase domain-containing ABC transporter [Enterobacter sp. SGAir0187]AVH17534.1 peptidase domain-containing ABC transporter [Enterobacter sp. SGAir0187]